jgi:hypothetical protein
VRRVYQLRAEHADGVNVEVDILEREPLRVELEEELHADVPGECGRPIHEALRTGLNALGELDEGLRLLAAGVLPIGRHHPWLAEVEQGGCLRAVTGTGVDKLTEPSSSPVTTSSHHISHVLLPLSQHFTRSAAWSAGGIEQCR